MKSSQAKKFKTKKFKMESLLAWALGRQGGSTVPVHKDDIVVFMFEHAPSLCCMRKYQHYPDTAAVLSSLRRATCNEGGKLIRHDKHLNSFMYSLTETGASFFEANKDEIEASLGVRKQSGEKRSSRSRQTLQQVALSTVADVKRRDSFLKGSHGNVWDFVALFHVDHGDDDATVAEKIHCRLAALEILGNKRWEKHLDFLRNLARDFRENFKSEVDKNLNQA